ncbi:MAG: hypothetical protein ACRCVA_12315, partial [Phreatobacter sp.]
EGTIREDVDGLVGKAGHGRLRDNRGTAFSSREAGGRPMKPSNAIDHLSQSRAVARSGSP